MEMSSGIYKPSPGYNSIIMVKYTNSEQDLHFQFEINKTRRGYTSSL